MKIELLKKFIKEAVKEAVREELKPLLEQTERRITITNESSSKSSNREESKLEAGRITSIDEALSLTKSSMTREDYSNILKENSSFSNTDLLETVPQGPQPGLDLSNLSFVKNAAAVFNKAVEKENNRFG